MSLSPNEKYPGATEADPNYKDSKFKDNNPSTTNNGSPLKALDRNEQLALQEAMMNAAGFDYNGVVDTPQNSQMFNAYKAALSNGANLLSNHNFIIASPDDSQPAPSATPTSYPPGFQIFSGVFANETTGILNLTYIDGRVSFSGGDFYMPVPNTGALENITEFVASVADFDGKPRTRGVSFALVGDEYRVTVGVDALEDESANETLLGSVKFEQGSVATGHEVGSTFVKSFRSIGNFETLTQNQVYIGDNVSTGGTIWKVDNHGPLDLLGSIKASFMNAVLIDDYDGISTDPAADNTPAFNALMNLAVWSSGQKKAFRLSGGTYNFSSKAVIPWNAYSISFFGLGKEVSEFHFDYDGSGVEGNIGLHVQCEVSNFHNMRFSSNDTNRDDMRVVVHETIKVGDARYADIDAFYTNCTFENGIYGVLCKGRGLNMSQCTFARCFNMIGFDAPNGEFFEPTNPASKHETALRRYYFSNIDGDGCDVLFKNAGDETYSQYLQGIVAVNCGGLAIATFFDGDIANSSFTNMIGYNPVAGSAWNFGTVTNVQINNPTVIGDYDPTHAPGSYTSSYDRFITASGVVRNLSVIGGLVKGTSDRDCMRFNDQVNGLTISGTRFAELTSGDATTSNYPLMRFSGDARRVNVSAVSIDNTYKSSPGQMGVMYELLNGSVITDSSITGVTQVSGGDEYRQTSDEDFGRFIPDMKCGGVSCTTSVSEGEFSKHGDIVTGTILIVVSSFNSTGDITIENLPYPALTSPITGKGGTATIGELTNGTGFTGHVGGRVVDGAIELKQYETATMSLGSVTDSNFTSPPTVLLSFVYSVN